MDIYTFLITLAFFATLVTLVVVGGNNRDRLAELALNILGKKAKTSCPNDEAEHENDIEITSPG